MLIDTGSTFSFIRPELIPAEHISRLKETIKIKTIVRSHEVQKETVLAMFRELGGVGEMRLLLFKFHQFFDGLVGIDILQQIGSVIDVDKRQLRTATTETQIWQTQCRATEVYTIEAGTKRVIQVPVQLQDGEFLINKTKIKPNMEISEGLYKATAGQSLVEITNYSEEDQELFLEEPLVVSELKAQEHIEINNIESRTDIGNKGIPFHKIRTDHLNEEEITELKRLCKKYPSAFYMEGEDLSFTNVVKHQMGCSDGDERNV
ncbi:uncharacterized protein LOC121405328 isoform X2 [Drosophila obscura]|uniref:uncharacterized protein LOC121405328 isoform X2 n=1 Tax=Drosophila obscura TaxID=7282 RepID=UPI001BB1FB31|nr:uncharacterized protein LOC121405328 isoform X2 [Drosophila obscura]